MSTYGATLAAIPWLFAAGRPRLVLFAITRTHGAAAATDSRVPSLDALSTTMTSHGTDGGFVTSASRQSSSASRAFHVTITTDTHARPSGFAVSGAITAGMLVTSALIVPLSSDNARPHRLAVTRPCRRTRTMSMDLDIGSPCSRA